LRAPAGTPGGQTIFKAGGTMHQQADGHHHHDDEQDLPGVAVGFRIFEDEGDLYLAEAAVEPYQDQPHTLGVTLIFHPLKDLDPVSDEADDDRDAWLFDFDDELTRDEDAPLAAQAQDVFRQLSKLPEESLREYLRVAKEEDPGEEA
jgi:hypothetical protein